MVKRCPECKILWQDSDEHCQRCGRPLGEECRLTPRDSGTDSGPGPALIAFLWFMDIFPGLASLKVIISSLLAFAISGVGFALGMWLFTFGAVLTAFGTGGGAMILYWAAWSWVLYGDVAPPTEALAELQSRHWMVLMFVTVLPMGTAIWIMKRMAAAGMG